MISALHLLWIVPCAGLLGFCYAILLVAAKQNDEFFQWGGI